MDFAGVTEALHGLVGSLMTATISSTTGQPLATMTGRLKRAFEPGSGGLLLRFDHGHVSVDDAAFVEAYWESGADAPHQTLCIVTDHGVVHLTPSRD
jgi:hypothetical protein